MTKREALKMFGSYYRIAQVLGIHRSNIGRWKRGVPKKRAEQLREIHDRAN
jgi:DNA-binding transcriptional regulator YdaS (Cro superfamily)